MMPLFHIHGLMAAVHGSRWPRALVWCAPGFDALKFFGSWLDADPTWYTAVPTMHQAILARAPAATPTSSRAPLRFLRSSSAVLPPQVMAGTGRDLRRPGDRRLWHDRGRAPDGSNPLPPRAQKPGSVGVAAGPMVRIAHEAGEPAARAGWARS
jgi:hypothetical protein